MLSIPSFIGSGKIYEDNHIKSTKGLRNFYDFETDKKTDSMPSVSLFLSKNSIRIQKTLDASINDYDRSGRLTVEGDGGIPGEKLWASASAQSFLLGQTSRTMGAESFLGMLSGVVAMGCSNMATFTTLFGSLDLSKSLVRYYPFLSALVFYKL
ncbi:hypothetical protein [Gilvimarinus japonicus]|uniref:Uncharacterized protein n=1 Tax=Gilvimarinus japonicus TaxID=1796469 RepID=A0ABV7HSP5_9GAMM